MSQKKQYYLLSAKISGIKNIHKRIELDFYKKSIDQSFDPDKYRIKGIFGENGFGKTAIITAFSIYQSLLIRASYLSDSGVQAYLDETINKMTRRFVMECEFAFIDADDKIIVYQHHICLEYLGDSFQIAEESLNVKNGNNRQSKYTPVFSVKSGEINDPLDVDNSKLYKLTANLLNKASLSAVLLGSDYLFEDDIVATSVNKLISLSLRMFISLRTEDKHTLYFIKSGIQTKKYLIDDITSSLSTVNERKILKSMYTLYTNRVSGMERFIRLFKPDLKSIDIVTQEDGEYFSCQLNMNYGDYIINKEFESEGIKKLISIYDALRSAANGGIVFIDEMDANINSIYLSTIIEYMMLFGKGQLCFTSHNIDIMQTLNDNKYSIDFLNSNQDIVRWLKNGNKSPVNAYKNGLIEGMPYNIFPADFVGVFGDN